MKFVGRIAALLAAAVLLAAPAPRPAWAQEPAQADWRGEFEAVCVKTDIALSLTSEELSELVARCDRLAERIGTEGETVRKVYLRRLSSCRALFAYVLETRGAAAAPPPGQAPPGQPPAAPAPAAPLPAQGGAPTP